MKREEGMLESAAPRVVHLVGRVSDEVFAFLGPTTAALAASGAEQTLVLIDDMRHRHLLPKFDPRVELVLTPPSRSRLGQWRQSLRAFAQVLAAGPVSAVHLHGLRASAFGGLAAHRAGVRAPVFYSLRGRHAFGASGWVTGTLLRLLHLPSGRSPARAIASTASQAASLPSRGQAPVTVVETPVAPAFFEAPRNEARHPLLIAGSPYPDPRSAEVFARLAVLLGGTPMRIGFNWVGHVDAGSRLRLQAANVGIFDSVNDLARAGRLASSWLFVAPVGTRRVPTLLVEALAVGLPVVAIDAPHHRELVHDGETGFVCDTEEDLLDCIARLIDSPALRQRLGQAARTAAMQRFSEARFRDALLDAYALKAPRRAGHAAGTGVPIEALQ